MCFPQFVFVPLVVVAVALVFEDQFFHELLSMLAMYQTENWFEGRTKSPLIEVTGTTKCSGFKAASYDPEFGIKKYLLTAKHVDDTCWRLKPRHHETLLACVPPTFGRVQAHSRHCPAF